jgi:hypothetical protein
LLSITELSTGEIAAAGVHRTVPNPDGSDAWLFILSAAGDSSESHFFGVPETADKEGFSQIRATMDDGFILLGDQTLEGQSKTPYLVKTNGSGVEEWSETFIGLGIGQLFDVIQTSDSGFLLTGYGDLTLSEGFDLVLIHTDANGTTDWTKQISGPAGAAEFTLHANYPNPFNPSTTLRFDLSEAAPVRLLVYDVIGREVVRLVDGQWESGYHQVTWNGRTGSGREAPTGIYIARLVTTEYTRSIKMVLMK